VTDELVEAVAKAISKRCWYNVDIWGNIPAQGQSEYRDLARAALQAIEESGTHVVVPVEVTDDMLNEAQSRLCEITNPTYFNDYNQAEMFKAMLAARPKVTTNG
jgi:hypothetical protein